MIVCKMCGNSYSDDAEFFNLSISDCKKYSVCGKCNRYLDNCNDGCSFGEDLIKSINYIYTCSRRSKDEFLAGYLMDVVEANASDIRLVEDNPVDENDLEDYFKSSKTAGKNKFGICEIAGLVLTVIGFIVFFIFISSYGFFVAFLVSYNIIFDGLLLIYLAAHFASS